MKLTITSKKMALLEMDPKEFAALRLILTEFKNHIVTDKEKKTWINEIKFIEQFGK
jgi:predicted nucleic acid-binding protein